MDPSCNRTRAHLLLTTYYCIPLYALPITGGNRRYLLNFPSGRCQKRRSDFQKWFSPKLRSDLRIRLTHSRLSPSLPRSRFPCGATVSIIAFPIIISNQITNMDIVSFFQMVVKECFGYDSHVIKLSLFCHSPDFMV